MSINDLNNVYEVVFGNIFCKDVNKILLINFEDGEVYSYVKKCFPKSKIDLMPKSEFVGQGFVKIIKAVRKDKYDLLVISNLNSQVNRSLSSIQLLALSSLSKRQIIIFDENKFFVGNKLSLITKVIPRLVLGIIYGLFVLLKTYFYIYVVYSSKQKTKFIDSSNRTIFFLRTDLAGKIIAGGSVSHIKGFICGAKSLGFDVIYVSDFPLIGENLSIIIKPNSLLDFFDELQMLDYHFRFLKTLKKLIKKYRPGVIYQRHSVLNASGVMAGKYFGIPVILEVNNSEVWAKKNWSRLFFEKLAIKMENLAFENADLISVVSDVVKEQIILLGADERKIIINPNGVDQKKFHPDINSLEIKKLYRLEENFVVGFIGTFTRWHGIETLFEAAIEISKINSNIKFLLIGDGNLRAVLEIKTKELSLEDRIIFTGLIPHDKAPRYLAACDVLVSPHLGFENNQRFFGSPTKLFEYMAMGKAIVASDLEQIGEIIQNEFNGLKFNPGDVEGLINCILRLYKDKELRNSLGNNARKTVINKYTWKMNAFRILSKIYPLQKNSLQ